MPGRTFAPAQPDVTDRKSAQACADSISLKTIPSAATRPPATLVRRRRVAKVDSIGFVVRR